MHHHPGRHVHQQAERREIPHRVVRELLHERGIDHEAACRDARRVTVGRALRDDLCPDDAARAGAVVDHQRLAEDLAHFRRQQAEENVAVASRRRGIYHAYRLGWKRLRCSGARQRTPEHKDEGQGSHHPHHSGSMPAVRATLIHFVISALLNASYASGVLPTGSAPWPERLFRTDGSASALTSAPWTRSMAERGVPVGASRPKPLETTNP